jgi:type I restriction enzyme S subunit
LFDFNGGFSASRDQLSTEGHYYLHYGDIHTASKATVDTSVDFASIPKLNIPLRHVPSKFLLNDGDVVFVDASEEVAGASKHVVVVNKSNVPFIAGLHTIVAKSKTDELANEYRRYCFQTAEIQEQFLFYAVGTKVTGISKANIPKLALLVPPVAEQLVITRVLMDMDAELEVLEQRREKTRALKQAIMQELLTGKTRLISPVANLVSLPQVQKRLSQNRPTTGKSTKLSSLEFWLRSSARNGGRFLGSAESSSGICCIVTWKEKPRDI